MDYSISSLEKTREKIRVPEKYESQNQAKTCPKKHDKDSLKQIGSSVANLVMEKIN